MFLSNIRISMLMLSISCCFASLQADFVTLSIWERTTPLGEKQHLICLGDRHDWVSKADEQSNDLIKFLEERDNPNDAVLIEDMSDFGYIIAEAKKYFKENIKNWNESCLQDMQVRYDDEMRRLAHNSSEWTALIKVGQKLVDKKKIKNFNADFRGLYIAESFTCLSLDWTKLLSEKLEDFVVKQIIKEIQKYDDGEFLNRYYQRCIQPLLCIIKESGSVSVRSILNSLSEHRDDARPLNIIPHSDSFYAINILGGGSIKSPTAICFSLLAELMDARLLHHIYQRQVQRECANVVVVCAGSAHNWNLEQKLPALGYSCIYKDGASSIDDLRRGISLSQSLKDSLSLDKKLYLRLQAEEEEREKQIERQAKIERRIKHIFLGLDDNIILDLNMHTSTQRSPAKLQAKL